MKILMITGILYIENQVTFHHYIQLSVKNSMHSDLVMREELSKIIHLYCFGKHKNPLFCNLFQLEILKLVDHSFM